MNEFIKKDGIPIYLCTTTERAFLDEIREKGKMAKHGMHLTIDGQNGRYYELLQEDFKANLKELVNDFKKEICPLCNSLYDSIEHKTSCLLYGG